MYSINTILCAVALSDHTDRILARALREAHVHGAELHVLHVLPSASEIMSLPVATLMGEEKFERLIEEQKTEIVSSLRHTIRDVMEVTLTGKLAVTRARVADVVVVEGDPVIGILDAAKRLGADMMVIGTHAKGLTEHTFMGDVAHKVLKRTRVPVLSIPPVKEPGEE